MRKAHADARVPAPDDEAPSKARVLERIAAGIPIRRAVLANRTQLRDVGRPPAACSRARTTSDFSASPRRRTRSRARRAAREVEGHTFGAERANRQPGAGAFVQECRVWTRNPDASLGNLAPSLSRAVASGSEDEVFATNQRARGPIRVLARVKKIARQTRRGPLYPSENELTPSPTRDLFGLSEIRGCARRHARFRLRIPYAVRPNTRLHARLFRSGARAR